MILVRHMFFFLLRGPVCLSECSRSKGVKFKSFKWAQMCESQN